MPLQEESKARSHSVVTCIQSNEFLDIENSANLAAHTKFLFIIIGQMKTNILGEL